VPGSPAEKAGMQKGDILLTLGGEPVNGLSGFNEVLKKHQPGDRVTLRWKRGDAESQADVELVTR
jgi:putative serine protease PepD